MSFYKKKIQRLFACRGTVNVPEQIRLSNTCDHRADKSSMQNMVLESVVWPKF